MSISSAKSGGSALGRMWTWWQWLALSGALAACGGGGGEGSGGGAQGASVGPVTVSGRAVAPDPGLSFVRPYRGAGDPCQLTGETQFTVDFLDRAADLVSCPTGSAAAAEIASVSGVQDVAQTRNFTLFRVPRRAGLSG
ncbi:MAG: hypothetical protein AAFR47_11160 [Pseudomonadota bacterium]